MQLVSKPFRGQATLGPVVVRAGSSKSHDVHGVLLSGVQVEVRGVGRCVVLVPMSKCNMATRVFFLWWSTLPTVQCG